MSGRRNPFFWLWLLSVAGFVWLALTRTVGAYTRHDLVLFALLMVVGTFFGFCALVKWALRRMGRQAFPARPSGLQPGPNSEIICGVCFDKVAVLRCLSHRVALCGECLLIHKQSAGPHEVRRILLGGERATIEANQTAAN